MSEFGAILALDTGLVRERYGRSTGCHLRVAARLDTVWDAVETNDVKAHRAPLVWTLLAAAAAGVAAFVVWWRGRGKEPAFELPPEPVAPQDSNAPDEPHEPPPPPPEPAPEPHERELAPVG